MTTRIADYTLRVVNGTTWRIYDDTPSSTGQFIEQYYLHENASNIKKLAPGQCIQKSFPHHHCLMKASLSSTQTLLDDKCLHRSYTREIHVFQPEWIVGSTDALARIQVVKKTPFTELTAHQKNYLQAQWRASLSRVFSNFHMQNHTQSDG